MKANFYSKLSFLILFSLFTHFAVFSANHIKEVYANQNFQISESGETFDIAINKNPWESFTFAIDNIEVINNPVVNLDIFSNEDISVRVDLTDGVFNSNNSGIIKKTISSNDSFTTLSFDFTDLLNGIDLSENVYLVFYINPGKMYNGEISIKNFNLSPEVKNSFTPTLAQDQNFKIFPSPATTFTNVEIPNAWFHTLRLFDMGGKEVANFDIKMYAGTTYRIELNNLPKGYYTVQLTDGESSISEKLIIN